MGTLRDIPWKISYGPQDDRLQDFFIPAMAASVRYDRAAGYFSSTMLAVAAAGVTKLILNGGKMRLLCGADLSEADVEAISQRARHAGRAAGRADEDAAGVAGERLCGEPPEGLGMAHRHRAVGDQGRAADRRHGPAATGQSRPTAITIPRKGLFEDADGNQIGFSGSVNESATALEDNYESFMVFNSWETAPYLANIRYKFDRLWERKEKDWIAMPIPEAVKQELLKYRPASAPTVEFPEVPSRDQVEEAGVVPTMPPTSGSGSSSSSSATCPSC